MGEIDKNPGIVYTDRSGNRNYEYISLGCDTLPVLQGRTPVQVYADFMTSFRDYFRELLGEHGIVVSFCWPASQLHCTAARRFLKFETPSCSSNLFLSRRRRQGKFCGLQIENHTVSSEHCWWSALMVFLFMLANLCISLFRTLSSSRHMYGSMDAISWLVEPSLKSLIHELECVLECVW